MIRPALYAALLIALVLLPAHAAETTLGVITIKEGELVVLRETREFAATEGLRLRADDIVRSFGTTRLARIELDDGSVLDLGPATELLLQPRAFATASERGLSLYLLQGWLKLGTSADITVLAMPQLGLARIAGSLVVRATPRASLVFVETGSADVFERAEGRPDGASTLKEGDAFAARGAEPGTRHRRPPADLIDGLPRAFADSLPRRAALWQGRVVEVGAGSEPPYASVAPWINAEALLRPSFVPRFAPLARERGFRASLVAELRAHPEWTRVLFPEKFKPKPVVVAAARRSAAKPAEATATPATEPALAQAPPTETP